MRAKKITRSCIKFTERIQQLYNGSPQCCRILSSAFSSSCGKKQKRTALVPVPDPSVEMVSVVQISAEGYAMVAVINGALAPRLDGVLKAQENRVPTARLRHAWRLTKKEATTTSPVGTGNVIADRLADCGMRFEKKRAWRKRAP